MTPLIPSFSSQSNPAVGATSIVEPQLRTLRGAFAAELGMCVRPEPNMSLRTTIAMNLRERPRSRTRVHSGSGKYFASLRN